MQFLDRFAALNPLGHFSLQAEFPGFLNRDIAEKVTSVRSDKEALEDFFLKKLVQAVPSAIYSTTYLFLQASTLLEVLDVGLEPVGLVLNVVPLRLDCLEALT